MIEQGIKVITRACLAFSVFMLVISLCSYFVGDQQLQTIGLFQLGRQGVANAVIMQGFLLCLTLSLIRLVVDQMCKMLLWKIIISFFAAGCVSVLFILGFHWFPVAMKEAWFGFICSFTGCFGLGCAVMIWKTKKENDEIQKLFAQFSERREHEHH